MMSLTRMARMPPSLRSSVFQQSKVNPSRPSFLHLFQKANTSRAFHATHRREFLEPVLIGTHSILETMHSVSGMPWAFTIPLTAVLVRVTILLPFTLYQRKLLQRQMSLNPLAFAWIHVLKKRMYKEQGELGPDKATKALTKVVMRKQGEILKRWGCQKWKTAAVPIMQLPVWLVVTETLRRMCGLNDGLFGMLARRLEQLGVWWSGLGAVSTDSTDIIGDIPTLGIEPTFATEGALWFPDLLVADPQLVLPFMLSGAILLNLFGKTSVVEGASLGTGIWQIRLKRSLGVVALAVVPMTLQVPSAMLVYWVSSATLGYVQAGLLDKLWPIRSSVSVQKPKLPLLTPEGIPNIWPLDDPQKKP